MQMCSVHVHCWREMSRHCAGLHVWCCNFSVARAGFDPARASVMSCDVIPRGVWCHTTWYVTSDHVWWSKWLIGCHELHVLLSNICTQMTPVKSVRKSTVTQLYTHYTRCGSCHVPDTCDDWLRSSHVMRLVACDWLRTGHRMRKAG